MHSAFMSQDLLESLPRQRLTRRRAGAKRARYW